MSEDDKHSFAISTPGGPVYIIGNGASSFSIILKNNSAVAAFTTLDKNIIIESHLAGNIDIEGDILKVIALREMLSDKKRTRFLWRFMRPFLFGQVNSDKKWIGSHYDSRQIRRRWRGFHLSAKNPQGWLCRQSVVGPHPRLTNAILATIEETRFARPEFLPKGGRESLIRRR